ncbi:MAG TPA: dipeptidase [Gemmatimonadota bacterium]|nr:dipeptidase [Gemmatimonadota bacterium]
MRRTAPLPLALLLLLAAAPLAAQDPDAALRERAREILRTTPLVDGHNDLPWQIRGRVGGDLDSLDIAEPQPDIMTDLERLAAGGVGAQYWSAYVPVEYMEQGGSARFVLQQMDLIHRLADRYDELEFARTADDVVRIHGEGKIASMIGIEGGHAIENSLDLLRDYHRLGARYMTLTHSSNTDWADASTDEAEFGGLTPWGEDVVREMNRLGMLVDLSHVSDSTMVDALRIAEAPVIFSHSSARALADVPRDVPDAVLRMLPDNGGVVMITFVPIFISQEIVEFEEGARAVHDSIVAATPDSSAGRAAYRAWREANPPPRATLSQVADHVEHVVRVAGIDHVGIGGDFDGISTVVEGLEDVSTYPALLVELMRRGWSDADLRKLVGENALRVMRGAEATAARLQAGMEPIVTPFPGEGVPLGYDE